MRELYFADATFSIPGLSQRFPTETCHRTRIVTGASRTVRPGRRVTVTVSESESPSTDYLQNSSPQACHLQPLVTVIASYHRVCSVAQTPVSVTKARCGRGLGSYLECLRLPSDFQAQRLGMIIAGTRDCKRATRGSESGAEGVSRLLTDIP